LDSVFSEQFCEKSMQAMNTANFVGIHQDTAPADHGKPQPLRLGDCLREIGAPLKPYPSDSLLRGGRMTSTAPAGASESTMQSGVAGNSEGEE